MRLTVEVSPYSFQASNRGLMLKKTRIFLIFALCLMTTQFLHASSNSNIDIKMFTPATMELSEVIQDPLNIVTLKKVTEVNLPAVGLPDKYGFIDPVENAGKVIKVSRDLVALGEDVYRLVIKGKPLMTTKYEPISVIPKVNGTPVDIFETENWKVPKRKSYRAVYKNLYGITVVSFTYSILFSYGGTYEGKGKFLTAAQVIPESVMTIFGYDFSSTMKLGGIQNLGTRKDPVAGATILLEHHVSTVLKAGSQVTTFFISGDGLMVKGN